MYRVQLFVDENTKRGKHLLGSWTCPTEEAATRKADSLAVSFKTYRGYEIRKFEVRETAQ